MKKQLSFIGLLLIFLVAVFIPTRTTHVHLANSIPTFSKIRISVFDEENQPLDMATIYIVETQEYLATGKLGQCELVLEIPSTNNIFKKINWQEYTLLIYKNGFKPHILYGLKAIPNINRTGVVIILKTINSNDKTAYTEGYDFPSSDYTINIINKYKK